MSGSKQRLAVAALGCLLLVVAVAGKKHPRSTLTQLGIPGVEPCETSAAVSLQDGRILVGDNETKDRLFTYLWDATGTHPATPFEITWDQSGGRVVEDIESLALDGQRIWVVGSHSRKKNCERDERRFRILRGRIEGSTLRDAVLMHLASSRNENEWRQATGDEASCLDHLFTAEVRRSPAARDFCQAVVEAERVANWNGSTGARLGGATLDCQLTLNIEGAAWIDGRLWVGLRAPLVGAGRKAVLLRVHEEDSEYRFDAVALVELEGRGIRELSTLNVAGRVQLWGIAGPAEHDTVGRSHSAGSSKGFVLWNADATQVQQDASLNPTKVVQLPPSSEGLVLRPPKVLLWIDGDGKYPAVCKKPHEVAVLPLP